MALDRLDRLYHSIHLQGGPHLKHSDSSLLMAPLAQEPLETAALVLPLVAPLFHDPLETLEAPPLVLQEPLLVAPLVLQQRETLEASVLGLVLQYIASLGMANVAFGLPPAVGVSA